MMTQMGDLAKAVTRTGHDEVLLRLAQRGWDERVDLRHKMAGGKCSQSSNVTPEESHATESAMLHLRLGAVQGYA